MKQSCTCWKVNGKKSYKTVEWTSVTFCKAQLPFFLLLFIGSFFFFLFLQNDSPLSGIRECWIRHKHMTQSSSISPRNLNLEQKRYKDKKWLEEVHRNGSAWRTAHEPLLSVSWKLLYQRGSSCFPAQFFSSLPTSYPSNKFLFSLKSARVYFYCLQIK